MSLNGHLFLGSALGVTLTQALVTAQWHLIACDALELLLKLQVCQHFLVQSVTKINSCSGFGTFEGNSLSESEHIPVLACGPGT